VTSESSAQGLFRILGPVQVWTGQDWQGIDNHAWRTVLTALLLRPDQVVPVSSLITEVWEDNPPPLAANLVALYVARLRQLTGDRGRRILKTRPAGYLLHLERDDLDAQRFEDLLAEAGTSLAARHPERAASLLHDALGLWHGPALADVRASACTESAATRLTRLRQAAAQLQIEADRACVRPAQVRSQPRLLMADDLQQPHITYARSAIPAIPCTVLGPTLPALAQHLDGGPMSDPSHADSLQISNRNGYAQELGKSRIQTGLTVEEAPKEATHGPKHQTPARAIPDVTGFDLCPNPLTAKTAADLVRALSQFRLWAGEPSFRDMERRCEHKVAASTMCMALTCGKLPRMPVIHAILTACGASQEHHQAFATAWRKIRMNEVS
jgi:hypothetical protein